MGIDHRKESLKLKFQELAPGWSESSEWLALSTAPQFL